MPDRNDPETWLTLAQIRAILAEETPSKWKHNKIFEEVDAAIASKLVPSQFWGAEERDRAFIMAHKRSKATMEAYEHHLHAKEMERESKKRKPKGSK